MSLYDARYTTLLHKAGITQDMLPGSLQQLIEKFSLAATALELVAPVTRQQLLFILVDTDAVICAALYSLYKDRLETTDIPAPVQDKPVSVDKIKLLAMKAKALNLKMNKQD